MTVKILDDKAKKAIDKAFSEGKTKTELAKKYGVHRRTIDRVLWDVWAEKKHKPMVSVSEPQVDFSQTVVVCTPQQVMITLSDGTQHTAFRDKEHFTRIFTLAMEEKYEEMMKYVDLSNAVKEFTFGTDISVKNGILYYGGQEVHSSIANRIVEAAQDVKQDADRYVRFFRKLYQAGNPDTVKHAYDFLVHNDLTIDKHGDIIAFKYISYVNGNPVDSYTKKVPNWKGWYISMPRSMVEHDPERACAQGLHVASEKYAGTWSEDQGEEPSVIKVSINPANIVSVPKDHDGQKLRCCGYTVLTGKEHPLYPEGYASVGVLGSLLSVAE